MPPIPSVTIPQGPPQGPVPQFNSNNSMAASSMASTAVNRQQAYYGPPNAYWTRGRFRPANSSPYWDPRDQQGHYPDQGYGGPQDHAPRRMFPVRVLNAAVGQSKPMIPAEVTRTLPHLVFAVGTVDEPRETQNLLDALCNSCAQVNTFKLSTIMSYCKAYPHHVKAIIDSKDGQYSPMILAGAVGDSAVLGALSTMLPVLVVLYTSYTRADGTPVYMSFACGECLSIRCIVGMPTLWVAPQDDGPQRRPITYRKPSIRTVVKRVCAVTRQIRYQVCPRGVQRHLCATLRAPGRGSQRLQEHGWLRRI